MIAVPGEGAAMKYSDILRELEALSDPLAITFMEKYGITPARAFGVSIPDLRKIAKEVGVDHTLALRLWEKDIRETRILASMIDDPDVVTEGQMDGWVRDFDYWEICDQCCMNLFEDTPYAYKKCLEWSSWKKEFEKRTGFVLIARLAVSDKKAEDNRFLPFLSVIKRESTDDRNYVKKAVNWALRQIGKRNLALNMEAVKTAGEIREMDSRSARWIASDALRELTGDKVQARLRRRKG
jgi:3-methyladenine DNA glycosylase AlkD